MPHDVCEQSYFQINDKNIIKAGSANISTVFYSFDYSSYNTYIKLNVQTEEALQLGNNLSYQRNCANFSAS